MEVRQSIHSDHAKQLDTEGLRREFLVETIFDADQYTMVYSHIDRIIVGGVWPVAIGHPCYGCNEEGIGFHKGIHQLANVENQTPR